MNIIQRMRDTLILLGTIIIVATSVDIQDGEGVIDRFSHYQTSLTREEYKYALYNNAGTDTARTAIESQDSVPKLSAQPPLPTALPSERTTNTPNGTTSFTEKFNTALVRVALLSYPEQNIVYSPISVQMLMGLLYVGANGETAVELQRGLRLPESRNDALKLFRHISRAQRSMDVGLLMANKIYHSKKLTTNPTFEPYLKAFPLLEIEPINFSPTNYAAARINEWVERITQNHIKNFIQPKTLEGETNMLLVNAIYFKGKWEHEFSESETTTANFMNGRETKPVYMMFAKNTYAFGNFPQLGAKVLELRYKNSDLSMMIILPNEQNDLYEIEKKLRTIQLDEISNVLQPQMVAVWLPRFRVEFGIDMVGPLQKLDINSVFTSQADLSVLFSNFQQSRVDKVLHRAFIEVNETGTTAAGATYGRVVPLSAAPPYEQFRADHPFVFAIRSPKAVYFIGHVISPWLTSIF